MTNTVAVVTKDLMSLDNAILAANLEIITQEDPASLRTGTTMSQAPASTATAILITEEPKVESENTDTTSIWDKATDTNPSGTRRATEELDASADKNTRSTEATTAITQTSKKCPNWQ